MSDSCAQVPLRKNPAPASFSNTMSDFSYNLLHFMQLKRNNNANLPFY